MQLDDIDDAQTKRQPTIVEASACNEAMYCEEDNIALYIVLGVFASSALAIMVNCCRERSAKRRLAQEFQRERDAFIAEE